MNKVTEKNNKRYRRHNRIRAKVFGTAERPRLAVYRSNKAIYAQLIDDVKRVTVAAADSRGIKGDTGVMRARAVGVEIATRANKIGVTEVVFDRGGFLYTGAIQELAEGARETGLKF